MDSILRELRYAGRTLRRNPGFTMVAVTILALGIGANTLVYGFVNAVFIRPLPWPQPDRIVRIFEELPERGYLGNPLAYPKFHEWREQSTAFEALAAYSPASFNLAGGDRPEHVRGGRTSATLPAVLRVPPQHGRWFLPEEDQPGADPTIVLSHSLWKSHFASDPEVVGSTVRLDGSHHVIVGVMPPDFDFPGGAQLWVPLARDPRQDTGSRWLSVVGRLRDGASPQRAMAELTGITQGLEAENPAASGGWRAEVLPFREGEVGRNARAVLFPMMGAVAFVLLIACANLANLMLARGAVRRQELMIRGALGASRGALVRQLFVESLLLAAAGASIGLLLASWGLAAIQAALPAEVPSWLDTSIDVRALVFTAVVTGLTAAAFGILPAIRTTSPAPGPALTDGGRAITHGAGRGRIRNALVIVQVALSLVLLVGAALLIRSVLLLQQQPTGFEASGVLTARINLAGPEYSTERRLTFWQSVRERVSAIPGVESVAGISHVPLGGGVSTSGFLPEGHEFAPGESPSAQYAAVVGDPVAALRLRVLRGRSPTPEELSDPATRVVMVGSTTAERFWPGQNPIGKRIVWLRGGPDTLTTVGVYEEIQFRSPGEAATNQLILTYAHLPGRSMTLLVRTSGDPAALASAVRDAVGEVDPTIPLFNVHTQSEVVAKSVWAERLFGTLFGSFAAVALLLAAIGIYGVISFLVATRTREIGIRMALGATVAGAMHLVLRQSTRLIIAGVLLGSLAAFGLTRAITGMLFGIQPTDIPSFLGAALVLAATALIASYLPARRAARVDPMIALRAE